MAEERDRRGRLASIFDLPGDVVLDVARITLVGDVQMAVENHRGLLEYNPDRVVMGVPGGHLVVTGTELVIGTITPEEIILMGKIAGTQFTE